MPQQHHTQDSSPVLQPFPKLHAHPRWPDTPRKRTQHIKGTYRLKNGRVISGLALSSHKRTCHLKSGPDISGTGPPPHGPITPHWIHRPENGPGDPAVSKVTHRITNRPGVSPTTSKMDPSPR
ncbi:hypothetical protein PAXRUDRAFT_16646 [Paxillus rubicundulus Ve08.2h10]|uniref:Uncharacterized protein n=1 Tax=Paxillus rubicundulus Ve08.2h10 TaxID=930991 RepID=A0A0D0DDM6_9AGAM|nr:hypothetical protein PAXRUDRAFT_16646 [Paxillus rubicundulus Ve08.2h10]